MGTTNRIASWIDGAESHTAPGVEVFEPATGHAYARLDEAGAVGVDRAVAAAQDAAPGWARRPARERSRILRKLGALIEGKREELALAESRDNGKPLALARAVDIPRATHNFEFFADAITQWSSEAYQADDGALHYVRREPLGVVACISPWNLPLYLLSWKIAPALAAGNAVVAKPSEVTPLTASMLGALAREAGLPDGVLNIVQGTGDVTGRALVTHPGVRAVSFTGSTRAGRWIAETAGALLKKTSFELGGKNPFVVFADADLDLAVATAVRAGFSNQGQICLCGSRILVEKSRYAEFRDRLVEATGRLRVGDPLDAATDQGAVVSRAHFEKILGCLEEARREGGRALVGGGAARVPGRCDEGWFVQPTVLQGLGPECRTNQEEIFGPVVSLQPFEGDAEAVALANATRYGLAASVFTRDIGRAQAVAAGIRAGQVWINKWMSRDLRAPFGGVGESGIGREGGADSLRFFTEAKTVVQ